jgi:hypothetical protein
MRAVDRIRSAETILEAVSSGTGGFGVEAIWLDETARSDPRAVPDALYVNRGETYARTLLYDTAGAVFLETSWGDWLEAEELRRATAQPSRRDDR